MEREVDHYYNDYKSGIATMLAISGLWPDDSKHPRILRIGLSVFAATAELVSCVGIFNFCLHYIKNVNALVGGMGIMISHASAMLKILIMSFYWRDVVKLNQGLSAQFENDLEHLPNRPHLLSHFRAFSRMYKFQFYYCAGIVLFAMSIPVLALRHGKYMRAHPLYLPFTYKPGGLLHWLIFAFEVTTSCYAWNNTVGVDSAFGLYAFQLVGELRLLSHKFRSLKSSGLYRDELKDCIDRHALLVESKKVVQRVFGFLSVWLAVTCAVVICAIIFQITENENLSLFKLFFLVDYIAIKLLQAFTYAWFGNIITVESELCLNSIYEADWPASGDLRLMNDVLIIQSQNPMYINAMNIMIVRLDMFMKIINTSVSYFFLLKAVEEKIAAKK